MLQIKTTPNLYGITLTGDYQDLNSLYNSLSSYLEFYEDNMSDFYPYHEYEYLLSLNYDIRHAFMGTRGVQIVENNAESTGLIAESIYEISESSKKEFQNIRKTHSNGNLYFSVEILYPLVFHYLISLENILDDEPTSMWFNKVKDNDICATRGYSRIEAEYDRAKIREFVTLVWKNVESLLGKDAANAAYDYYYSIEFSFTASIYCDALLHCQSVSFPDLSRNEKLSFLTACLYEIIDTEDLSQFGENSCNSAAYYKNSITVLNNQSKKIFPTKEEFYKLLEIYHTTGTPLYEEEFEEILEKEFGPACDDESDW